MQLIKGGPHLPNEVLRALEAGDLVCFCGAGISSKAGLPDFKQLVGQAAEKLKHPLDGIQEEEFERGHYDRVLGLLEKEFPQNQLRHAIVEILTLPPEADLKTHHALLTLARNPGGYRLVTTNFDRGFELAATHMGIGSEAISHPQESM